MENFFVIKPSRIAAFFLGMAAVFIVFTLQAFEIKPVRLINPLVQITHINTLQEKIFPKLSKLKNDYSIKPENPLIGQAHAEGEYGKASAYAAVDYDLGEIILGENIDKKLPIASLTKIMSAVVALDLASPDDFFTVSEDAAKQVPTKIGVVKGEKMKVSELLNAALLTSANDAVEVLRDGIDQMYGRGAFITAMNEKARVLELNNTHFSNPQGFDSDKNYSSVSDLAVLSHYALANYPLIAQIVKKDYEFLPTDSNHKQFDLYNWNGLIGVYPETIGLKIGNTGQAQHTTIVLSQREGKKILAVVLGAPKIQQRDLWTSQVLDSAYQIAFNLKPVQITEDQLLAKYKRWKYF